MFFILTLLPSISLSFSHSAWKEKPSYKCTSVSEKYEKQSITECMVRCETKQNCNEISYNKNTRQCLLCTSHTGYVEDKESQWCKMVYLSAGKSFSNIDIKNNKSSITATPSTNGLVSPTTKITSSFMSMEATTTTVVPKSTDVVIANKEYTSSITAASSTHELVSASTAKITSSFMSMKATTTTVYPTSTDVVFSTTPLIARNTTFKAIEFTGAFINPVTVEIGTIFANSFEAENVLSLSFWLKLFSTGLDVTILTIYSQPWRLCQKMEFQIDKDRKFGLKVGDDTKSFYFLVNKNILYNFVLTLNFTSNNVELYVNSSFYRARQFSSSLSLYGTETSKATLGASLDYRCTSENLYFDGFIGELDLWGKSLSKDEIKLLFYGKGINKDPSVKWTNFLEKADDKNELKIFDF